MTAKAPAGAFGTPVTMTVCDARVDAATEAQLVIHNSMEQYMNDGGYMEEADGVRELARA